MNAQSLGGTGHSPVPNAAVRDGSDGHDITGLLKAWRRGDRTVLDRLLPLVYEDLRRIAHRRLGHERDDHTLGTTALVNETYLRLVEQARVDWTDRAHFFAVAATAMRRILVDYARRHHALKRGGSAPLVSLPETDAASAVGLATERAEALLALEEQLQRLAGIDQRLAQVVECRFFGGLTEDETAAALGVTARTVRRDWVKAKAWLYEALRP